MPFIRLAVIHATEGEGAFYSFSKSIYYANFKWSTYLPQSTCTTGNNPSQSVNGSGHEDSVTTQSLRTAEAVFIDNLRFQGIDELIHSLKTVHDLALYHTDLCFGPKETAMLYQLKVLSEELNQIGCLAEEG